MDTTIPTEMVRCLSCDPLTIVTGENDLSAQLRNGCRSNVQNRWTVAPRNVSSTPTTLRRHDPTALDYYRPGIPRVQDLTVGHLAALLHTLQFPRQ